MLNGNYLDVNICNSTNPNWDEAGEERIAGDSRLQATRDCVRLMIAGNSGWWAQSELRAMKMEASMELAWPCSNLVDPKCLPKVQP